MNTGFHRIGSLSAVLRKVATAGVVGLPVIALVAAPAPARQPVIVMLPADATGAEIQRALDALPAGGGEVVLPPGVFKVNQPIVLRRNHQELRGAGVTTVLYLADNANCPVVILGEPANNPKHAVGNLRVSNLFVDGNRQHQQRELWRTQGEGSEIRNNGIILQNVRDSTVERVTCARCRSGGLVTTRGVRRLTVRDLTAFDNEFDGLACYQTEGLPVFTALTFMTTPAPAFHLIWISATMSSPTRC